MGINRRTRGLLIASVVVVALVVAVTGYRVWSAVNQREKTAAAFAVLNTADRRIDLSHVFPKAKRSKSGVEVRPLGEGPGPVIAYSFHASSNPGWEGRLDRAMQQAGYGSGGDPWLFQVHGWPVGVTAAGPEAHDGDLVIVTISTR